MPQHSLNEITGTSRVFGVIADPIDHVRAPMVFNPVLAERGIDAVLVPFHIRPENLESAIRGLAAMPNLGGVCVTIPHKMALAELCDELGLAAQLTGAVNAVRFEDGRLMGDNFDGQGFVAGLTGEGIELAGRNALMIGAGGAARAIAAALATSGAASLTIANRTEAKAAAIVDLLATPFPDFNARAIASDQVEAVLADVDLVINTTALGLHPDDALPCALKGAGQTTVVADIIMIPAVTDWMKEAENLGLRVHPGRHMLDYQRDLIGRFIGMFE